MASPPVQALNMLAEGGLLQVLRLSASGPQSSAGSPKLGQHTAELLTELGYRVEEVETLREKGIV